MVVFMNMVKRRPEIEHFIPDQRHLIVIVDDLFEVGACERGNENFFKIDTVCEAL